MAKLQPATRLQCVCILCMHPDEAHDAIAYNTNCYVLLLCPAVVPWMSAAAKSTAQDDPHFKLFKLVLKPKSKQQQQRASESAAPGGSGGGAGELQHCPWDLTGLGPARVEDLAQCLVVEIAVETCACCLAHI